MPYASRVCSGCGDEFKPSRRPRSGLCWSCYKESGDGTVSSDLKLLFLDIETTPNVSYTWGTFKQDIAPSQIVTPTTVLCWAAKWGGSKDISFERTYPSKKAKGGLLKIHSMLDDADAVVHYNGTSFDIPRLNQEFLVHGLTPPAPYKQIDLFRIVAKKFSLPSNKLEFVGEHFGVGGKVKHTGMRLWIECMAGDDTSWGLMEKYNKQDVFLLEGLYQKLLPWIDGHRCVNCGSHKLQSRGHAITSTLKYKRYQCQDCGKWQRDRLRDKDAGSATLVGAS